MPITQFLGMGALLAAHVLHGAAKGAAHAYFGKVEVEKRDAPENEAMTAREEVNNSFSFIHRNSLFGKLNPSLLSNCILRNYFRSQD